MGLRSFTEIAQKGTSGIIFHRRVGPFLFNEGKITVNIYHDLLTKYLEPQLTDLQPIAIFQHNGALPHWEQHVRQFINQTFPERWIERDGLLL